MGDAPGAHGVALARRLDLDDLSAVVAEQLPGKGPGDEVAQFQDAQPDQGTHPLCRGHGAECREPVPPTVGDEASGGERITVGPGVERPTGEAGWRGSSERRPPARSWRHRGSPRAGERRVAEERMAAQHGFEFRGINHLALVCSDMARTVDFYTNVLGMPLVKTIELPAGMGQHFFFDCGGGDCPGVLLVPRRPSAGTGHRRPDRATRPGQSHQRQGLDEPCRLRGPARTDRRVPRSPAGSRRGLHRRGQSRRQ